MSKAPLPFGTYAPGLRTRSLLALSQNTPLGRGKARKMMAGFVRDLNVEMVDARLFGLNARLHMHNNSSEVKALINPARYSRAEFAFAGKYLPPVEGVFVDVGANAGLFSMGVASLLETGTLLAFEPQPKLFARLETNLIELNPELISRVDVRLFNLAIGAEEGELVLSVPEQLGQASARVLENAHTMSVKMENLFGILSSEDIARIDVLKLDVEGFEDEVILPFLETAPESLWPRAIILEHCHRDRWGRDCEALLIGHGYVVEGRDRTNLMLSLPER